MKVGTKSVLWGVHCFLVHPWFVALAWWRLYGFPLDPRLWIAFFVHDLGYWGKPNMDGPEGETHPELGGRIMGWLFDKKENHAWYEFIGLPDPDYNKWRNFTLGHSRYYAGIAGIHQSKLCAADKLAFCFEPYWFYMLRARMSGEIYEYLDNAKQSINGSRDKRVWFNFVRRHFLRWVAGNYKNMGDRRLKNGDKIRMTYLPPCKNGKGSPNPYMGMKGVVHDLQDGKFSIRTENSWLVGLDIKTDRFEFL